MIWTVLESAAITVVFTTGSIFDAFRERGPKLWRELARCPLCAGVWIGAVDYLVRALNALAWRLPEPRSELFTLCLTALGAGALAGCAALAFRRVADWLESSAVELDESAKLVKAELDAVRIDVSRSAENKGESQ